jgi:hypothetical protein
MRFLTWTDEETGEEVLMTQQEQRKSNHCLNLIQNMVAYPNPSPQSAQQHCTLLDRNSITFF